MLSRVSALYVFSVVDGVGIGKHTFAMSHPWEFKSFMETHFPTAENMVQENSTQSCVEWVKLCIDDGHMTECRGPQGNFQLHSVGAYKRAAGSKSMEELELGFTQSFGDLDAYDPYFEYHTAFLTPDLDAYVSTFDAAGVPYFASTFTDSSNTEYHSVLVQVPGSLAADAKSLLAIELLGTTSAQLSMRPGLHRHALPRASPASLARAQQRLAAAPRIVGANGKPVLAPVHLSFASSDLDRDITYFEGVLMGSKVSEATDAQSGQRVYTGKMLSSDAVEIRYVQAAGQTQGPLSVAKWESYQTALHKECFDMSTNQGFDRLADNHLGHALGQRELDPYIAAQQATGLPYRFYTNQFVYLYAPNGWGVQLIGQCSSCPSAGGYNMCTQGITGHCSVDGAGDIEV